MLLTVGSIAATVLARDHQCGMKTRLRWYEICEENAEINYSSINTLQVHFRFPCYKATDCIAQIDKSFSCSQKEFVFNTD